MARPVPIRERPEDVSEAEWRRRGEDLLAFLEQFRAETDLEELDVQGFLAVIETERSHHDA